MKNENIIGISNDAEGHAIALFDTSRNCVNDFIV